jgi:hypothetical protein
VLVCIGLNPDAACDGRQFIDLGERVRWKGQLRFDAVRPALRVTAFKEPCCRAPVGRRCLGDAGEQARFAQRLLQHRVRVKAGDGHRLSGLTLVLASQERRLATAWPVVAAVRARHLQHLSTALAQTLCIHRPSVAPRPFCSKRNGVFHSFGNCGADRARLPVLPRPDGGTGWPHSLPRQRPCLASLAARRVLPPSEQPVGWTPEHSPEVTRVGVEQRVLTALDGAQVHVAHPGRPRCVEQRDSPGQDAGGAHAASGVSSGRRSRGDRVGLTGRVRTHQGIVAARAGAGQGTSDGCGASTAAAANRYDIGTKKRPLERRNPRRSRGFAISGRPDLNRGPHRPELWAKSTPQMESPANRPVVLPLPLLQILGFCG